MSTSLTNFISANPDCGIWYRRVIEVQTDEDGMETSRASWHKRRDGSHDLSRAHEGSVDEVEEDQVHNFRRVEIVHKEMPASSILGFGGEPIELVRTSDHTTPGGRPVATWRFAPRSGDKFTVWYCFSCGFGPLR